jgi:hypothetical protein
MTTKGSSKTAFPRKVQTTFRMMDRLNVGGTSSSYTWRLNSLYDPDYTSTGKQPYMYDQYSAVYNRYRVIKTELIVDIVNNSSTVPCAAALYVDNVTTSSTSYTIASVLPFA